MIKKYIYGLIISLVFSCVVNTSYGHGIAGGSGLISTPSGLSELVDDLTPQLGGDLDLNGFNIDFPTTPDISDVIDDDTMGTASDTTLSTSESIKAYADSVAGAPTDATYITQTPDGGLSAEQAINALGDGLLKHASGVFSQAVSGTDYITPAGTETLTNKTIDDDTNSIHANTTYEKSRNVSGSLLVAGTPVYASGYNAGQDRTEIEPADADVAATMPAIGIIESDLIHNANGHVIEIGIVENIDTTGSPVSESWSVGDMLYVSTTVGTLTNVRPSVNGDEVQFIATVTRSHATLGRILVQGSGRANDIPNNLTIVNTGAYRTGTTAADTAILSAYDVDGTTYVPFATLTAGNDPTFDLEPTVTIGSKAIQSQVLARIAGSTFSTVQHLQDIFHSAGWVSGGVITDDADGTITVATGTGLIRATDSAIAQVIFTDWAAESGANVNLADNNINYVYVEYNSGTPQVIATTVERTDFNKNILLAIIQRTGTVLHINNSQKHVVGDHANSMIRRLKETNKFVRVSGAVISATGTRNWAITTGDFWEGLGEFTLAAFDSSGADSFSYWYRKVSDSGWNEVTTQSAIHQTNYDDNSGSLATLSNNKYGIHWCYMETDDHAHVVYGQGDYTLSEAEDANPPSGVPEVIEANGILIGKIIIKKSDAAFTQIESQFGNGFTPSIAVDHGALIGLTDVADHAYALLIDGTRALTGAWDMDSQNLSNVNIDSGTLDGITTLQMPSGDIGATGARITKGWFTDLEVTNPIVGSIASPGLYARERDDKWALKGLVTAADRYTLETPIKLQIEVNSELHNITSVTEYDLSAAVTWDTTGGTDYTVAANRAGLPFYIYAIDNSGTTLIEISANSTVPDGYTAATSRKIGGFDCLCVDVGTISAHLLTDFLAGDILPASIWDYDNRPVSSPEGMVLALSGRWIDIYLPSVSSGELVSEYNATIADGASTEKFHTYKFEQWFARIGKKTISQLEFVDASIGSNQGTNITGSADPGTTGGHSDTAGRRMISDIGCEDMCGALWQWGRDTGAHIGTTAYKDAYDGEDTGVAGQSYEEPFRPRLGGAWADGAACGSRGSLWNATPLDLGAGGSSRGVAEPKN